MIHITAQKATIHLVTTMLTTSKMSYFQVITIDPSLIIILADSREIIKVSGHQYRWLAGGYDLEINLEQI